MYRNEAAERATHLTGAGGAATADTGGLAGDGRSDHLVRDDVDDESLHLLAVPLRDKTTPEVCARACTALAALVRYSNRRICMATVDASDRDVHTPQSLDETPRGKDQQAQK